MTQQRVPVKLVKVSPAPFHNSVCRRVLWQTSLRSSEFRFHCAMAVSVGVPPVPPTRGEVFGPVHRCLQL